MFNLVVFGNWWLSWLFTKKKKIIVYFIYCI